MLRPCPECTNQISSQALACSKCRCPIKENLVPNASEEYVGIYTVAKDDNNRTVLEFLKNKTFLYSYALASTLCFISSFFFSTLLKVEVVGLYFNLAIILVGVAGAILITHSGTTLRGQLTKFSTFLVLGGFLSETIGEVYLYEILEYNLGRQHLICNGILLTLGLLIYFQKVNKFKFFKRDYFYLIAVLSLLFTGLIWRNPKMGFLIAFGSKFAMGLSFLVSGWFCIFGLSLLLDHFFRREEKLLMKNAKNLISALLIGGLLQYVLSKLILGPYSEYSLEVLNESENIRRAVNEANGGFMFNIVAMSIFLSLNHVRAKWSHLIINIAIGLILIFSFGLLGGKVFNSYYSLTTCYLVIIFFSGWLFVWSKISNSKLSKDTRRTL